VKELLLTNPVLAGAAGLILSGALMYLLRSLPAKALDLFIKRATAEIAISDNSPAFGWTEEWLADRTYSAKAKRVKLSYTYRNGERMIIVPGYGSHWFWENGRPMRITREENEKLAGPSGGSREKIVISTLDFGRRSIERIYRQILDYSETRGSLRVLTCDSWGNWTMLSKREHRKLDSVFISSAVKEEILSHVGWYLDNRQWFTDRGIPYRTGLLLYGPPGTGKTSLVQAIAGVFDLTIYILNPADLDSDNALKRALANVGTRSILLIEDVDTSVAKRDEAKPPAPDGSGPADVKTVQANKGPTLSAVLNALDGIGAAEGRVLVMTTNHIDRLDSALIRDGRVNLRVEIGSMGRTEVLAMGAAFLPDRSREFIRQLVDSMPAGTGAEWQTRFADVARRGCTMATCELGGDL